MIYCRGQVWERDGKRRKVYRIRDVAYGVLPSSDKSSGFYVAWGRGDSIVPSQSTWWPEWLEWSQRATLVLEGAIDD